MSVLPQTTDDLLREILVELRLQRQAFEAFAAALRRPAKLSARDRQALARLLPCIWVVTGQGLATFSVRELFARSELTDTSAIALREALAAAGGGAHKIGKLLRRAAGVEVGAYRLEAHGRDRDGNSFTLRPAPNNVTDRHSHG